MFCSCCWCHSSVEPFVFSSFIEKHWNSCSFSKIQKTWGLGLTLGLEFCSDRACRIQIARGATTDRSGFAFESFIICAGPFVVCAWSLGLPKLASFHGAIENSQSVSELGAAMTQAMALVVQSPNLSHSCCSQRPHSLSQQGGHRKGGLLISANSSIEDSSRAAASWRTQTKARRAKPYIVAASSNEGDETKEASDAPSSVTEVAKPAVSEKRAQAEAEVKKGQRTAIVTGVISVLLGVGYLVLIQLLDTRGIILVPPPPEAFDP